MTVYARPGASGALMSFPGRYENFIGGQWTPPAEGLLRNPPRSPARCSARWPGRRRPMWRGPSTPPRRRTGVGRTTVAERALLLNRIADRIETNLEQVALAESWDNGKPIRETLNADIPLAVDHFRYLRGHPGPGGIAEPDRRRHRRLPLPRAARRGRPDHPLELPDPDGGLLAPALAAGNAVVLKPAEQTPASVMFLISLIADLLPPGVLNVVNGFGVEAGKPLASVIASPRSPSPERHDRAAHHAVRQPEPDPGHPLELGGKSPNIFFSDVMAAEDDFQDKALGGLRCSPWNQGEVCTCPSRSLIQADIYDDFLALAAIRGPRRSARRPPGHRDHDRRRPQRPTREILSYIDIGRRGRRSSPAASAPIWAATSPAATTSSRRSSPGTTRCGSSRRRSSARSSR